MKSTVILEYVTRRESGKTASSEGPILFLWSWEKLKDQLMLLLYLTKIPVNSSEQGIISYR